MNKTVLTSSDTSSYIDKHIGNRLRLAREQIGETAEVIARALKLQPETLLRIEAGELRLDAPTMMEAAAFFRQSIGWFYEGLAEAVVQETQPAAGSADIIHFATHFSRSKVIAAGS